MVMTPPLPHSAPAALPPPGAERSTAAWLGRPDGGWRLRLYTVIFESDTPLGRLFDKVLIGIILLSIVVVVLDSVASKGAMTHRWFTAAEWLFTVAFTLEYAARLLCVQRPWRYARSFFGVVDLLALAPTYLALFFPELHALIDVRVLRLLRVFRVFKLTAYMEEYQALGRAISASGRKILVFLSVVLMIVLVSGTLMYVVEGPQHGFTSIPTSVYWAITTMTTVGFGDITPKSDLGRFIASAMMLLGWGTLAVPTGIVTSEMSAQRMQQAMGLRICDSCGAVGHLPHANFCMHCGSDLPGESFALPKSMAVSPPPRPSASASAPASAPSAETP